MFCQAKLRPLAWWFCCEAGHLQVGSAQGNDKRRGKAVGLPAPPTTPGTAPWFTLLPKAPRDLGQSASLPNPGSRQTGRQTLPGGAGKRHGRTPESTAASVRRSHMAPREGHMLGTQAGGRGRCRLREWAPGGRSKTAAAAAATPPSEAHTCFCRE